MLQFPLILFKNLQVFSLATSVSDFWQYLYIHTTTANFSQSKINLTIDFSLLFYTHCVKHIVRIRGKHLCVVTLSLIKVRYWTSPNVCFNTIPKYSLRKQAQKSKFFTKFITLKLMLAVTHHLVRHLFPLPLMTFEQVMFPQNYINEHLNNFQFLLSSQEYHLALEFHHW